MIEHILFDLDGTLTDPGEGITRAVQHALAAFGIAVEDRTRLYCFIGPPLADSFHEYYGISPEECERAIDVYREYFGTKGLYENELYPAVPGMLRALEEAGKKLYVATSKPEQFAKEILAHFGLAHHFLHICGSPMDHSGSAKADVVRRVLQTNGINPAAAIMVGDRRHDVIGARENGLPAVGVLYGYGSREEFAACGANYVVETPEELVPLLLGM